MAITADQTDVWLRLPSEHERLEFKEAKTQFDNRRVCEYCVAIGNEGGGHLVLGVTDALPRKVVGTQCFDNLIAMSEKLFQSLGFRVDIEEIAHPDGGVVVFQIPSRARGTAFSLHGTYLMRCGESLQPMSEDRLRKIFAEGEPDWLEEPSLSKLSSSAVLELLDTKTFLQLRNLPPVDNDTALIDRLLMERLVDEEHGLFSIRRMGALLLAKDLRRFPDVARKAARVIVYRGSSKLDPAISDSTARKGYAVGFQLLIRFINQQLPQNEIIKAAIRKEVKLVPEIAIRELVANALIHQDLSIGGTSVMIEVYSNRLEISNPGTPLVPVERFIDAYQSRNERLADLMRRMGICEERSSGVDKVVQTAEVFQLPAPDFRSMEKRTMVTLRGPMEFKEMDREERLRACYQHCALKWVMSEYMTNQSLRERFHVPESKSAIVSQVIAASIEAGQIKPDEKAGTSRRFARYIPYWG